MAQQSAAQAARAAQLQAAAREAAGLPPLERPTATSVTTVPPNIPPPNLNKQSSAQLPRRTSASYPMPGQPQMPPGYDPRRSLVAAVPPQQQQQQQQQRPPTMVMPQQRRAPAPPPLAAAKKTRDNSKSTPPPSLTEGRLAWQTSSSSSASMAPLVGQRIQELVRQLDPSYTIDAQAEEQVLQLADDFLDKVCKQALRLSQHRGSKTVDVADVQFALAKSFNIVIPGLGPPVPKKPAKASLARASSTGSASTSQKRKASMAAGGAVKLAKSNSGVAVPTTSSTT